MSELCQRNKESRTIIRNKGHSLHWGVGIKARRPVTATVMHFLGMLPRNRREKVQGIRRQIAEGTYDLDKRLDSALDRLLQDIVS